MAIEAIRIDPKRSEAIQSNPNRSEPLHTCPLSSDFAAIRPMRHC